MIYVIFFINMTVSPNYVAEHREIQILYIQKKKKTSFRANLNYKN